MPSAKKPAAKKTTKKSAKKAADAPDKVEEKDEAAETAAEAEEVAENSAEEAKDAAAESDEDAKESDEAKDSDGDDDDDKKKKKKKEKTPKKKISFDNVMAREEAVAYFEAIIAGLKKGSVEFKQGGESLAFSIPSHVGVGVEATKKGSKCKVEFELSWREGEGEDALKIS